MLSVTFFIVMLRGNYVECRYAQCRGAIEREREREREGGRGI